MKKIISLLMLLLVIDFTMAIDFTPKANIDMQGRYMLINLTNITMTPNCAAGQTIVWSGGKGSCGSVGNVSSTGSAGYIPRFVSDTLINNSAIFQNGTNIGIGTTTPTYMLTVSSTIQGYNLRATSTGSSLYIPVSGYTTFGNAGLIGTADQLVTGGGVADLGIRVTSGQGILFSIDSSEKMRVASTGRLGIGETVPGSTLSVSGGQTIGSSIDTLASPTNGLFVEANVGFGSTSNFTNFFYNDTASLVSAPNFETGSLWLHADSGITTLLDFPVTNLTNNTEQSYSFNLDGNNYLKFYSTSDGIGGLLNKQIQTSVLFNSTNQIMGNFTALNGSVGFTGTCTTNFTIVNGLVIGCV